MQPPHLDITINSKLKSLLFREERELNWIELDRLVNTYERCGVKELSDEEILAAPVLYRSTLSALSVARSTSLDRAVIDYLESLCARSYFFIYGSRATVWDKLDNFFRVEWRLAVCDVWKETLVSALLLALGIAVALILYGQSVDWYFTFMPAELAGGRNPGATTASLRGTLYHVKDGDGDGLSLFATSLFAHNSRVALMAFASGFAFGIPSAILIASSGATMGVFIALFVSHGLGYEVGGWLIIHGMTEILAFVLAGAAGLNLGRAIAFPGDQSRLDSLAKAGVVSGTVMAGCIVMLLVAGLLEGFGRQLITSDIARYFIGAISGMIWFSYFYWPRKAKAGLL